MHRLRYGLRLSYEVVDQTADFVFNIEAANTARQVVVDESLSIEPPLPVVQHTDAVTRNRLIRLRAPSGPLSVRYSSVVEIDHLWVDSTQLSEISVSELPFDVLPFLSPSRYCESDRLMEFSMREFGGLPPGCARVMVIRDWVRNHVRFVHRSTNERTSAADTVVERMGVCRDFSHLMIAICRALSIPARMTSSLDYGADPARGASDFHAVVEVYLSHRWYLFDPSGVSIPSGLLRIGTGRDAADIPFAAIFGNVIAERPSVEIMAMTDLAEGIGMPLATTLAISTW